MGKKKKKGGSGAQETPKTTSKEATTGAQSLSGAEGTSPPKPEFDIKNEENPEQTPAGRGAGRGTGRGAEKPKGGGRGTAQQNQQKPKEPSSGGSVLGGPPQAAPSSNPPKSKPKAKAKVNFQEGSSKKSNSDSEEIEIVTPGASNKKFEFNFDATSHKPTDDPDNPFAIRDKDSMQDLLEKQPPSIQTRIKALRKLHSNFIEVKKDFHKELFLLEKKYEQLFQPSFNKRKEIVSGAYEPSQDDLPEEERDSYAVRDEDAKGIPEFWLQVFQNNDIIAGTITEKDVEAIKYLTDVTCTNREQDFELQFYFSSNPYFTDTVLTKTYHRQINEEGEEEYTKSEGCKIHWKPGKNLTVQKTKLKKKKKGAKKPTIVMKETPCESFFRFFSPPEPPEEDEEEEDEEDQDRLAELDRDYDIGSVIKESIIPIALLWYTGEVAQDPFPDDLFGYGDDDDDDGDFDDEDDDDEDTFPVSRSKKAAPKKKGGHQHAHTAGTHHHSTPNQNNPSSVEQPPDCKTQ